MGLPPEEANRKSLHKMNMKENDNTTMEQNEEVLKDQAAQEVEETQAEEQACPENEGQGRKECRKDKKFKETIEALTKENETLKAGIAKEKDDYVRLMADFENFRRHSAEAKLELVSTAAADTIKGLLPVLDDCERAIKMLAESSDEVAKEGTEMIYNKLMGYLKTKGLEMIPALGEKFDTDLHEAVAQFPVQEEEKKGLVFDVVQTGYKLSGKVIRYAKVVVAI